MSKAGYTERVSTWQIQKFVEQVVQGRKVLEVKQNCGCPSVLLGGKSYMVSITPYTRKETDYNNAEKEEFVFGEFGCRFYGIEYEDEWVRFMAKEFGTQYIEAYKEHEEERIEQELGVARSNADRQKKILNQAVCELLNIANTD
jgi:hypothetical protein